MNTRAAITVRNVPNDALLEMQEQLAGLHIHTDFTDHRGRLVQGRLISARRLDAHRIGVSIMRYLDGGDVVDGACISSGEFMPGRAFRTAVHIPEDHAALAILDAVAMEVAA